VTAIGEDPEGKAGKYILVGDSAAYKLPKSDRDEPSEYAQYIEDFKKHIGIEG
jgi:hypothetical protein